MKLGAVGSGWLANTQGRRKREAKVVGLMIALGLLAMSLAACGAPEAAEADATFYAEQTSIAASRPSPTTSPTATATTVIIPTPTLATPDATATIAVTETVGTETVNPTATVPSPEAGLPARLNGTGTDVSKAVSLNAGVLLAQITHVGSGPFVVTLLDANGEPAVELADGMGAWVGSRAIVLPETGAYVAEVTADGDWQIELDARDPATSIISELPFEQTGGGSQALYFVRVLPGDHTLAATHDGVAGFSVSMISSDGSFVDEVLISSGLIDTLETFTVPEPPAGTSEGTETGEGNDVFLLIDIRASGSWTIRVE